jgi:hypothetical protein
LTASTEGSLRKVGRRLHFFRLPFARQEEYTELEDDRIKEKKIERV